VSVRKIVLIDEEKCNGCGLCIPNCAEGALQIIDGKAKLIGDVLCDGLGACLGHCPQDAIQVVEREAEEFNEIEVEKRMGKMENKQINVNEIKSEEHSMHHGGGCPGSRMRQFSNKEETGNDIKVSSKLRQWPVQLTLVGPNAPYFKNADLLITADCVPFAYANYHNDFLKDKAVVVGCPKLDDVESYVKKLTDIIANNNLESITVLKMEVPCCGGIASAAKTARDNSGVEIPIKVVTIGIEGEVMGKQYL
jgi:NAD-dependent dihydropyrimidine dehydrogenase PreA subunit